MENNKEIKRIRQDALDNFLDSQRQVVGLSEVEMRLILRNALRLSFETFLYKHLFFATVAGNIAYYFFF